MRDVVDDQIIEVVRRYGAGVATYVVRNALNDFGKGPNLKTAQVLRRLKKLEAKGAVERAPSNYVTMISWCLPRSAA